MRIFGELLVVFGVFTLLGVIFASGIPAKVVFSVMSLCLILPGWKLWQRKKKE
jgi:hypothetical protein